MNEPEHDSGPPTKEFTEAELAELLADEIPGQLVLPLEDQ